jgi:hypothetical protein
VEFTPVRVPLKRRFKGSHYSMTSRCTIVTRVYTTGGLVGEAYNGDTDAEQSVILGILRNEIAPNDSPSTAATTPCPRDPGLVWSWTGSTSTVTGPSSEYRRRPRGCCRGGPDRRGVTFIESANGFMVPAFGPA